MALDLSAGSLVRSGSYVVLAVLGALLIARSRHGRWNRPIGLAFVLAGASGILYNLIGGNDIAAQRDDPALPMFLGLSSAFSLVGLVCWAVIGRELAATAPRRPRTAILAIAAAACLLDLIAIPLSPEWHHLSDPAVLARSIDGSMYGLLVPVILAVLGLAAEAVRRGDRLAPALWFLAFPAVIEVGIYMGQVPEFLLVAGSGSALQLDILLGYALTAIAVVWTLRATGTRHGWTAVAVTGSLLGTPLLVALLVLARVPVESSGAAGVLLLAADLAALYGILRFDLIGRRQGTPILGKTALASVALAGLFITAQVLQNVLGARLGLLWGGVVAGAVVFAASPLQKAAERLVERRDSPTGVAAAVRYRRQVELAWADGRIGTKERLMLAEARESLGLDPAVAHAIEDEFAAASHAGDKRKRTA
ncbi:MAG: hypothetical protein QOJ26_1800 [Thermoplasmata archaeon]|jgi:hypothetical protein|nr:hypothetical protein [Thermoplasmata archaeon]MEA3166921.1 hypothetical protein [Thermoplasmata archaeon]